MTAGSCPRLGDLASRQTAPARSNAPITATENHDGREKVTDAQRISNAAVCRRVTYVTCDKRPHLDQP